MDDGRPPTAEQLYLVEASLPFLPRLVLDALLQRQGIGPDLVFDYWLSTYSTTGSFIRMIADKYYPEGKRGFK